MKRIMGICELNMTYILWTLFGIISLSLRKKDMGFHHILLLGKPIKICDELAIVREVHRHHMLLVMDVRICLWFHKNAFGA